MAYSIQNDSWGNGPAVVRTVCSSCRSTISATQTTCCAGCKSFIPLRAWPLIRIQPFAAAVFFFTGAQMDLMGTCLRDGRFMSSGCVCGRSELNIYRLLNFTGLQTNWMFSQRLDPSDYTSWVITYQWWSHCRRKERRAPVVRGVTGRAAEDRRFWGCSEYHNLLWWQVRPVFQSQQKIPKAMEGFHRRVTVLFSC